MDSTQTLSQQQIQQSPTEFTSSPVENKLKREHTPRPTPIVTMNDSEMPVKSEAMATAGIWTTPTSQMRPRPATIHEGFSYSLGEEYGGIHQWDSSSLSLQQTPSDTVSSRPISMHQEYYTPTTLESNPWNQKPCEDPYELPNLDGEMNIGQAYTTDEAIPILDLRYQSHHHSEGEPLCLDTNMNNRRMSGSSFTMSTSGGLSEMASYEDFSAALSEAPSFGSEYPPTSNRNSLMSSTQLSPVASPRMTPQSRSELVRTHSRGRASPSPRPGMRTAPYSVDAARNKRWSTGSYGPGPNRRPSPFVYHPGSELFAAHQRMSSRHSSPTIPSNHLPLNYGNLQAAQQHAYLMPGAPAFRNSMLLPSQLPSQLPSHAHGYHPDAHHHFEAPPPLLSHGLFRMLQSNADPHALHSHYTDLSDPPDLYASLHEEQIPPPPEDMNPSDPDLVPHEQELRFEGDLYTPRWVRGHGNKREGWCGICKPGRWLVLKNSAFWYDKSFTHGISAATGSPFQEPQETRRMDGNPDVWEGLCGSCNEWIALVSSKKKGTTWFRHAYKCHTHPKIKDAPKRRRESTTRTLAAPLTLSKPAVDVQQHQMQQQPLTPQQAQAPPQLHLQLQPHHQYPHQHQHQPPLTPQHQVPQPMTPGLPVHPISAGLMPIPSQSQMQLQGPPQMALQQMQHQHQHQQQPHHHPSQQQQQQQHHIQLVPPPRPIPQTSHLMVPVESGMPGMI